MSRKALNDCLGQAILDGFDAEAMEAEIYVSDLEAKLAKAVAELDRLGFDFDSNLGRELKPITEWPEETGNITVGKLKLQSSEFATQKGETHE